jgi:uncharacterized coiled-coil protein SlyX
MTACEEGGYSPRLDQIAFERRIRALEQRLIDLAAMLDALANTMEQVRAGVDDVADRMKPLRCGPH